MIIRPVRRIRGQLKLPGDKSISHRAAMISALADGVTRISNYSSSADCQSTLACLRQLGVTIEQQQNTVIVHGSGATGLRQSEAPLDCGNSGTTMRLLAGILAGQNFSSTLTGDDSLRTRPMQRIIEPLEMMGARIASTDGRAPLTIHGHSPLRAIEYELLIPSAQVKSCILLAGTNADGETRVIEKQATRNHTESMLRDLGAPVTTGPADRYGEGASFASIKGPASFNARDLSVPGDISSAAFFVAAATLLPDSQLEIVEVGLNPSRDEFLKTLESIGAQIHRNNVDNETSEPRGTLKIRSQASNLALDTETAHLLNGKAIASLIDELPLLAVVGSQIKGGLEIRDAKELRVKESDRIDTTVRNLRAMGAEVEEFEDGLRVAGQTRLHGAHIEPQGDHRIAMSFAIAGLLADGETEIADAECVGVSFPEFFDLLDSVTER
jgi:3-phosphoshikimate 1-carboxyvinyltransferase